MNQRTCTCLSVLVLLLAPVVTVYAQSGPKHQGETELERILLSGDQAPGFPKGVLFDADGIPGGLFVGGPTIGAKGEVGFAGLTSETFPFQQALWIHSYFGFGVIAASGDPAPDTSSTFASLPSVYFVETPDIGSDGGATFSASLADPHPEAIGGTWLREGNGSTRLIVLTGDPVPGVSGASFQSLETVRSTMGAVLVAAQYSSPGGSTAFEDEGFWRDVGNGLELVVRDEMPAPGTPQGVVFGHGTPLAYWATFDRWSHNGLGDLAFNGYLKGPGINELNDEGIWAEGVNGLRLVAREGQNVPAAGQNAVLRLASGFRTFGTVHHVGVQINNGGSVLFGAAFSGPNYDFGEALWTTRNGSLEAVAKTPEGGGGNAPDMPGYAFEDFIRASLNEYDQIAFHGYAFAGSSFRQGIWTDVSGQLRLAAGELNPVPVIPGAKYAGLELVHLADKGHLTFSAWLTGSNIQPTVNDRALFVLKQFGKLQTVIRRGDAVDLSGNGSDVRIVKDWVSGKPNELLQFPLRIEFTDGSMGIFRAHVNHR